MTPEERENWERIKLHLQALGKTDSFFYKRAVAISDGKDDPMEPLPELEDNSPSSLDS